MKKHIIIGAGIAALAVLFFAFTRGSNLETEAIVATDPLRLHQGTVVGRQAASNPEISVFNGIPYATAERWRKPAAAPQWGADVRLAQEYGPECMQSSEGLEGFQERMMAGIGMNWLERRIGGMVASRMEVPARAEECLFLNVRTANIGKPIKQPVMVWIHGGSHVAGSGSTELYQSDTLVENGIVLVTINYRLGAFGYLAHPALSEESDTSGNYGLLDQIAALRWVQKNIALFGGDPTRVTIAGESAGAQSISELMASPLSEGLFQQAILQSGVSAYLATHLNESILPDILPAEEAGEQFFEGLAPDTATADELRSIAAEIILQRMTERPDLASYFLPVVDKKILPDMIARRLRSEHAPRIPMLIGYNANEGTLFYDLIKSPTILHPMMEGPLAAREANLEAIFGRNEAKALEALYGMQSAETWEQGATDMLGDDLFGGPTRFLANQNANAGAPTWTYIFTRPWPSRNQTLGASHAAEISFMMNTHPKWMKLSNKDKELTESMTVYWSNFIKTGDPNGQGLADWPRHDAASDQWIELGTAIKATTSVRARKLDILQRHIHRRADVYGTNSNAPELTLNEVINLETLDDQ